MNAFVDFHFRYCKQVFIIFNGDANDNISKHVSKALH